MKNERILAYQLAQKLDENDLQDVSAGKWSGCRPSPTYNPQNPNQPFQDPGCSWDPFD